ncbi:MAG: SufS family cysteine desulfurase [Nitrososphaerota archaeon]
MYLDPLKIREDFPIFKREINGHKLIYLDNAATTQKPIQVINAIKDYYEKYNANVHRAVYTLSQESTRLYEEAHYEIAKSINAKSYEEIIFVKNTTEAINFIAYTIGLKRLKKGDEVIITLMDHHSNIIPWILLEKIKGIKVKYVGVNPNGTLRYNDFEELINNRTKIISFPHISNVLGTINDAKYISKIAHENNALVVLDAAQSVPHIPFNVKEIDCDFAAFSGHKMLGPTGIGVLYAKKEIIEDMEPFIGGGDTIYSVIFNEKKGKCNVKWNDLPWRFEGGTQNIAGGIGLMEAVKYLKRIGMEKVKLYEREITEYALKRMENELEKTIIYGIKNIEERSGIIAFNINNFDSNEVALILDQYGIAIRSGFHCAQPLHNSLNIPSSARISFYIYNTKDEIDKMIEILKEIEKLSER